MNLVKFSKSVNVLTNSLRDDLLHIEIVRNAIGACLRDNTAKDYGYYGNSFIHTAIRKAFHATDKDEMLASLLHLSFIIRNSGISPVDIVMNNRDKIDFVKLANRIAEIDPEVYPTDDGRHWVHIVGGIASGKLTATQLFSEYEGTFADDDDSIINYALNYCIDWR